MSNCHFSFCMCEHVFYVCICILCMYVNCLAMFIFNCVLYVHMYVRIIFLWRFICAVNGSNTLLLNQLQNSAPSFFIKGLQVRNLYKQHVCTYTVTAYIFVSIKIRKYISLCLLNTLIIKYTNRDWQGSTSIASHKNALGKTTLSSHISISTVPQNVFKHLKHVLEVELQEFKIFVNHEIFVWQPAWSQKHTYCFNCYVYSFHTS